MCVCVSALPLLWNVTTTKKDLINFHIATSSSTTFLIEVHGKTEELNTIVMPKKTQYQTTTTNYILFEIRHVPISRRFLASTTATRAANYISYLLIVISNTLFESVTYYVWITYTNILYQESLWSSVIIYVIRLTLHISISPIHIIYYK